MVSWLLIDSSLKPSIYNIFFLFINGLSKPIKLDKNYYIVKKILQYSNICSVVSWFLIDSSLKPSSSQGEHPDWFPDMETPRALLNFNPRKKFHELGQAFFSFKKRKKLEKKPPFQNQVQIFFLGGGGVYIFLFIMCPLIPRLGKK